VPLGERDFVLVWDQIKVALACIKSRARFSGAPLAGMLDSFREQRGGAICSAVHHDRDTGGAAAVLVLLMAFTTYGRMRPVTAIERASGLRVLFP
jgi:hypothetical protein